MTWLNEQLGDSMIAQAIGDAVKGGGVDAFAALQQQAGLGIGQRLMVRDVDHQSIQAKPNV